MSRDYALVCEKCKAFIHVGQTMAGVRFTAGYGSNDQRGQEEVGEFICRHGHGKPLCFTESQGVPDGYTNEGSP
jgi:hypothetical protein